LEDTTSEFYVAAWTNNISKRIWINYAIKNVSKLNYTGKGESKEGSITTNMELLLYLLEGARTYQL
jgi:hypothetical protein